MKNIYTAALVVLALAAGVATVCSAPLETDTVQSTSLCSGHGKTSNSTNCLHVLLVLCFKYYYI